MLVGQPSTFAIESAITCAYSRPSQRALGFFVLHISGHRFGVSSPDASLLACSFDEVGLRLSRRGTHTAEFGNVEALVLARSLREALYFSETPARTSAGISSVDFARTVQDHHLLWAPD